MFTKIKNWLFPPEQEDHPVEQAPQVHVTARKQQASKDNNERIQTILVSGVEIAKVFMATMLSIFVPQYCPETGTTCTLQDNFSNLTMFNEYVIVLNFITLGMFCWVYWIQSSREFYFISHLDQSKDQPYNSLVKNIYGYPKILQRVKQYNRKLLRVTRLCVCVFGVNTLSSCVLIFRDYYDGFRSVSTLVANVLLVTQKLWGLWCISYESCGPQSLALSTTRFEQVSYNVIDPDYSVEMVKVRRTEEYRKRGESVSKATEERLAERIERVQQSV